MRCLRYSAMMAAAMLLGGALPGWAQGAACTAPDVPMRPIMSTHTIPPYPELSVMTNEAGTTLLEVHIGADGVPTATSVLNSSGSLRLDSAAADYVKSTWRWNAPVKNCQPLAVVTRVSIKWDLKDAVDTGPRIPTVNMDVKDYPPGPRQRREQGSVTLMVIVSPDGQIIPFVITSSGFPELDEKSMEIVKAWHFAPASLEGRPLVTPVMLVSVWSLDGKK